MTLDNNQDGGVLRRTTGRGRLFDGILDTVGDTPAVRINHLAPDHVTVYVKCEFFNPAASVKDRLANVERIVTDDSHRLTQEIESLRVRKN